MEVRGLVSMSDEQMKQLVAELWHCHTEELRQAKSAAADGKSRKALWHLARSSAFEGAAVRAEIRLQKPK